MRWSRSSSSSRRPWRWASASRATHSVAVLKATRWPARQARIPSAIARWVLPVPGGPSRTTFSRPARKSSWPRCSDRVAAIEALEGEVELLERLARREPRGLDAGLAAVAVAAVGLGLEQRGGELLDSSTPPARARSASLGSARAAAGALSARNRCASSVVGRLMRSAAS